MTNSTLYQSDIEPVQRCIGELLERIIVDYQQTKEERRSLSKSLRSNALPEREDAFTVLEELELAATDLQGYASPVQLRGRVENAAVAVGHLKQLRLFDIPSVAAFYFESGANYPRLKETVRRLDYLRLLLLEFLQGSMQ